MYIAIRKPNGPSLEKMVVFNNEKELVDWCAQVGATSVEGFIFRRLGDVIIPEITTTVTLR